MKEIIKIKKNKLLNIVKFFSIINKKKNDNFIFQKKKKKITFIYRRDEIQLKIYLKIKNLKKEKFFLNLDFFKNIIKNSKKKILKIVTDMKKFFIKNYKDTSCLVKNIKIKNYKILKKKNIIFFFTIKEKTFNIIYNIFNCIDKTQKENFKNFKIFIKKNIIKLIITDNYQLCCFLIKEENIIFKKKNIILENKILKLIKEIIKNRIKINICKNYIIINKNKTEIISKLVKSDFLIIKNFKKKYKKYLFLKKKILEESLYKVLNIYKNQDKIKILIKKNIFKINFKLGQNKIFQKFKIDYKYNELSFIINGNKILNFLKNLKYKDIILNFSKKNNLVITVPQIKGFKYTISIIKF